MTLAAWRAACAADPDYVRLADALEFVRDEKRVALANYSATDVRKYRLLAIELGTQELELKRRLCFAARRLLGGAN